MDFTNTILIMTSNLGSEALLEPDLSDEAIRRRVEGALKAHFRPEFLNRVDEVVFFRRLDRTHLRKVVDIQLGRLAHVMVERGITITVSDRAKDRLADEGFDPVYGARPLKRLIQRTLQNALAGKILAGEIGAGDTVEVDAGDEGYVVRKVVQAEVVQADAPDAAKKGKVASRQHR